LTIATIRALIPDRAQLARDTFVASGELDLQVKNPPLIAATVKVYLSGVLQLAAAYTVDADLGLVTFVAAPAPGTQIVVAYQHTLISDTDLTTFLTLEGDDRLAAADALDSIADQRAIVEGSIRLGDYQIDGSRVADSLRKHAASLREQVSTGVGADGANWAVAELVVDDFSYRQRLINEALRNGGG
jgi:hypothetical protein